MSDDVQKRVARALREAPLRRTLKGANCIDPEVPLTEAELANAEAALSALRPGDRIGDCVLVPIEPTAAMIQAFNESVYAWQKEVGEDADVYRAMIAAAELDH